VQRSNLKVYFEPNDYCSQVTSVISILSTDHVQLCPVSVLLLPSDSVVGSEFAQRVAAPSDFIALKYLRRELNHVVTCLQIDMMKLFVFDVETNPCVIAIRTSICHIKEIW
jgi:hypothetical protein